MENSIDVSEIMKELDEKIKKGLAEKSITVTDISRMIGEHIEKAKGKIVSDATEIIKNNTEVTLEEKCKDCGGKLKKTKK